MKEKNKKVLKNKKGITLIALVITIIVMLILVAVTISLAINGGLFGYAGNAAHDTEFAKQKELELANIESGKDYDYLIEKFTKSDVLDKNEEYTDTNGDKAVIPQGFKLTDENIVRDGLVIEDAIGNQFVWIPVNYTETGNLDSHGLDSGFLAVFKRTEWDDNRRTTGLSTEYTEPYESGYTGEDTEYYNMMKSVQKNKGFYIGRYEAGTTTDRLSSNTPGTTPLVVKQDAYPYNYVAWGQAMNNYGHGAVYLSKTMYDPTKYGVTSTLCYGVEWDAMLDFIKDSQHNVTTSSSWGNYYTNTGETWKITRQTAKYYDIENDDGWHLISEEPNKIKEKNVEKAIVLTTGANDNFKAKNIYDVAGNLSEWTMEAKLDDYRTYRGGYYDDGVVSAYPAKHREWERTTGNMCFLGFRPALYINNIEN